MKTLKFDDLLEHLQSDSKRLRMWAVYQLIEHWQDQAGRFIGNLLESEVNEIKEAGVFLVGKCRLERFAFQLFGLFHRSQGKLKQACAIALTSLEYQDFRSALWRWLKNLLEAEELKIPDLQCAAQSWLSLDAEKSWERLEQCLEEYHGNHLKSLYLFGNLCATARFSGQILCLMKHYAVYRKNFTDPQFIQHLSEVFDCVPLLYFLQTQTASGAGTSGAGRYRDAFHLALNILNLRISAETEQTLLSLDKLREVSQTGSSGDAVRYAALLTNFCGPENEPDDETKESPEAVCLAGFRDLVCPEWDATVIKVQDQENLLRHTLPLHLLLRRAEQTILENPLSHFENLARLYFSPLLRESFRDRVLEQLSEQPIPEKEFRRFSQYATQCNNSRDVLWRLITGFPEPEICPYPVLLPRPWQHHLSGLLVRLTALYRRHFDSLVKNSRGEHLDYALELFLRQPDEGVMDLMLKHFTVLINEHFPLFFDFIEKYPDQRFIDKLQTHYREGETAVAQLLFLLCTFHHRPFPLKAAPDVSVAPDVPADFSVADPRARHQLYARVFCPACRASYHYSLSKLYFDEEAVEQRRPFMADDLWTPEQLRCKNCDATLPFHTDPGFRSALYTEMLTAQLLKLSEEEQQRVKTIRPLKFPRYFQRKMNPEIFLKRLEKEFDAAGMSAVRRLSPGEQAQLLLELGKFRLALEEFDAAQEVLQQSLELSYLPATLFHLGTIAFRQKNLFEARLHFSRLVSTTTPEEYELEEENFHQLATHYLEILDRREVKRSAFRLIQ